MRSRCKFCLVRRLKVGLDFLGQALSQPWSSASWHLPHVLPACRGTPLPKFNTNCTNPRKFSYTNRNHHDTFPSSPNQPDPKSRCLRRYEYSLLNPRSRFPQSLALERLWWCCDSPSGTHRPPHQPRNAIDHHHPPRACRQMLTSIF